MCSFDEKKRRWKILRYCPYNAAERLNYDGFCYSEGRGTETVLWSELVYAVGNILLRRQCLSVLYLGSLGVAMFYGLTWLPGRESNSSRGNIR